VGLLAVPFQAQLDFIGDGLDLAGVGAAAQQEVVGEGSNFAEVQDLNLASLFTIGRPRGNLPRRLGLFQFLRSRQS
jgi:hypothetical protein